MLKFYMPGTLVRFINAGVDGEIDDDLPSGMILNVIIGEDMAVRYGVSWWDGYTRSTSYFSELEFVVLNGQKPVVIN